MDVSNVPSGSNRALPVIDPRENTKKITSLAFVLVTWKPLDVRLSANAVEITLALAPA